MAAAEELLHSLQRGHHSQQPASGGLDPEDEARLQYLRGATRETRRKIEGLESDLYNTEKAYAAEVALRRSLEQRLSSRLVDMYNSHGVNSELQQRLPRSHGLDRPDDLFTPTPPDRRPDRGLLGTAPTPGGLLGTASSPGGLLGTASSPGGLLGTASSPGGLLMTSPMTGAPLVLSPVSLPFGSGAGASPGYDPNESRQLSALLSEMDAVKEENRRLQARYVEAQKEIDAARATTAGARGEMEALVAAQASDLVKEIHAAQKSRDEAMMVRLRIANDERDAALERLHDMERADEVKPQTAPLQQEAPVSPMRANPVQQDNRAAAEMETLREERDAAVLKFQQLQQEYNSLQRSRHPPPLSGVGAEALLGGGPDGNAEARRLAAERDEALRRLREVEDEIQTLRVYYSLHKSLAPEVVAGQAGPRDAELLREQNAALQDRVQALAVEVEEAREAEARAAAELQKANRVVAVLRRKLNSP